MRGASQDKFSFPNKQMTIDIEKYVISITNNSLILRKF
jgi:hypothetical protein